MTSLLLATEHIKGPHIDYQGLSPLLAPLGGALIVLIVSLFPGRFVQRMLVPLLTLAALFAGIGLAIWRWNPVDCAADRRGRAGRRQPRATASPILVFTAGIATVFLSWRSSLAEEVGPRRATTRCCSARSPAWCCSPRRENLITLFIGLELLSIPLYVLCGARVREEKSLEAGLKYLIIGSVGSATLLYGLALIYGASGSTDFGEDLRLDLVVRRARRPAAADRHRADRDGARVQGLGRAVPPVDARRLPGRPHPDHRVHGGVDQGRGVRDLPALLRRGRSASSRPTGRPRSPRWRRSRS